MKCIMKSSSPENTQMYEYVLKGFGRFPDTDMPMAAGAQRKASPGTTWCCQVGAVIRQGCSAADEAKGQEEEGPIWVHVFP